MDERDAGWGIFPKGLFGGKPPIRKDYALGDLSETCFPPSPQEVEREKLERQQQRYFARFQEPPPEEPVSQKLLDWFAAFPD